MVAACTAIADRSIDEVLKERRSRRRIVACPLQELVGRYRGFAKPVTFSSTPGPQPFAAPAFGQHSEEVLKNIGYTGEDIVQLRRCGVVGPHDDTHLRNVDA